MNTKTDTTLVYQHPDGFTLAFNDNVLTATDDEDNSVCLPIGPLGLPTLADAEQFLKQVGGAGHVL